MDVWVEGKRIKLNPARSIGKGGEADVFDVGDGKALKLWKAPNHPDYAGAPSEQDAARARLATHQRKLRAFPARLPSRVVAPRALATDKSGAAIVGFTMSLVGGAEALLRYGEPAFGKQIARDEATRVLTDLAATLTALHGSGVVVGDFNDLNVLVRAGEAWLIDADSFQFGDFQTRVFTERFVDPLLCDPKAQAPALVRPFNEASDWYAFAALAVQTLLFVGPWGGIHKPKDPAKRVPQGRRSLARVCLLDAEVVLPKHALPPTALPDDLLQELFAIFAKDRRGPFPVALLDRLAWRVCSSCQGPYARAVCPRCVAVGAPLAVAAAVIVRGEVTCTRLFRTRGVVVAVSVEHGQVRWIAHEEGRFVREDGAVVVHGALDPTLFFAIDGQATLVGKGGRVLELEEGERPRPIAADALGLRPLLALNATHRFYARGGCLYRAPRHDPRAAPGLFAEGEQRIGDVLAGQTLFWVGPSFGVGFYRAGNLTVAFVFGATRGGLKDDVALPRWAGQLVAATAVLDESRAWLLLAIEEAGRTTHRCVVITKDGRVEGSAEAEAGDGSWLGTLRGKCALNGFLLAPTDAGIVRVELDGARARETRRFPDTEPFTTAESELFVSKSGVVVADDREIKLLKIL